jgi:hypothetical protein
MKLIYVYKFDISLDLDEPTVPANAGMADASMSALSQSERSATPMPWCCVPLPRAALAKKPQCL